MTAAGIAHTNIGDSAGAGAALGQEILSALGGERPDALIVFASSRHDYRMLLIAIERICQPGVLVGCSSAGEFTTGTFAEGSACAIGLRSDEMRFSAGVGRGLASRETADVAADMLASFNGRHSHDYRYQTALVLTDALAGHADNLVEQLTLGTAGTYHFVGGGAGDDAAFQQTHVFCGTEALSDAAVALEILSNKPVGIGVSHGWQPASQPLRVTEARATSLVSLNAIAAVEAFKEHAEATTQPFTESEPLPFFLHNVLGIDSPDGYKLRVPLGIQPDGCIACAAEVPTGAAVRIMNATGESTISAAAAAARSALEQLGGEHPAVALFFDCVATRLRMGREFDFELESIDRVLGTTRYAGCNTYGQIARAEGQFSGFHNCTAVVCVIPE